MFSSTIEFDASQSSTTYPVMKKGTITGRVILYTAPGQGVVLHAGTKVRGWKQYDVGSFQTGLKEGTDVPFVGWISLSTPIQGEGFRNDTIHMDLDDFTLLAA